MKGAGCSPPVSVQSRTGPGVFALVALETLKQQECVLHDLIR